MLRPNVHPALMLPSLAVVAFGVLAAGPVGRLHVNPPASHVLAEGELLCLFPEGAITRDGQLQTFKGGIMKILESQPVPVIPSALHNLWGSTFSRIEGAAMSRPLRRGLFNRVGLVVGEAMPPEQVSPELLQARVQSLLDEPMP